MTFLSKNLIKILALYDDHIFAVDIDIIKTRHVRVETISTSSGVGTYLSGTARAVPLLKVGRLVMHFAVPLFGHRLHISQ